MDTLAVANKRKYIRIKGSWPVVVQTAHGALVAETRNITPQGAYIACDKPLPSKTELRLYIMFSNRRYIEMPAKVIWSYPYGSAVDNTPPGMGIRFTRVADADREFISSLSSGYLKF
jgi:Tfp pilus assembly protein PilZ